MPSSTTWRRALWQWLGLCILSIFALNATAQKWSSGGGSLKIESVPSRILIAPVESDSDVLVVRQNILEYYVGDGRGGLDSTPHVIMDHVSDVTANRFTDAKKYWPSLVLIDSSSGSARLLLLANSGAGAYSDPVEIATGFLTALSAECHVVSGDFNADGYADIAVSCPTTNVVYFGFNDGSGVFLFKNIRVADAGYSVDFLETGTADNSKADDAYVGVVNRSTGDSHTVLVSVSSSGELSLREKSVPYGRLVNVADLNGDGTADVLIVNNQGTVDAHLDAGKGIFADAIAVPNRPGCVPLLATSGHLVDVDNSRGLDVLYALNCGDGYYLQSSLNAAQTRIVMTPRAEYEQAAYKMRLSFAVTNRMSGTPLRDGKVIVIVLNHKYEADVVDGKASIDVQLQKGKAYLYYLYTGSAGQASAGRRILFDLHDHDGEGFPSPTIQRYSHRIKPFQFSDAIYRKYDVAPPPRLLAVSQSMDVAGPYLQANSSPENENVNVTTPYTNTTYFLSTLIWNVNGPTTGGGGTVNFYDNGTFIGSGGAYDSYIPVSYDSGCDCYVDGSTYYYYGFSFSFSSPGTHNIVATLSLSGYSASGSASFNLTSRIVTPSLSIWCSPNPITYGSQNTTCYSSLTGGNSPTGSITWTANGGGWTTTPINGSATGWAGWAPGTYPVGATYSGDGGNRSVGASTSITINKATPSGYISCSPATITYGSQTSTCAPFVNAVSGGATPSGSVSMYWAGNYWGAPAVPGGSLTGFNGQPVGTYSITGTYNGNGNYNGVGLSAATVTIVKTSTSLSIGCSGTAVYGSVNMNCSPTLTGAVSPASAMNWGYSVNGGGCTPGTWVSGYSPSSSVGTWAGFPAESITVCAQFVGDANNNASNVASTSFTIQKANTSTSVSCSPNPLSYGSGGTTCTVSVSGTNVTGNATMSLNGSPWNTGTLSSGSVAWGGMWGSGNPPETNTVSATYNGDSNNKSSSSSGVSVSVVKSTPAISVSCTTPSYPNATSCTVHVSAVGNGTTPTGSITYVNDGGTWGTVGLSSGVAVGVGAANAGGHTMVVNYSGDSNYNTTSTSTGWTETKGTPSISVTCSPNPVPYGQNTTCTTSVGSGSSGSVTFTDNGTPWATPSLSGGIASATGYSGHAPGNYTVGAVYSGDSNFNSSSTSTALTVAKTATTTVIWTGSNGRFPAMAGQPVPVYAQVLGGVGPSGSISFSVDGSGAGSVGLTGATTTNLVSNSTLIGNSSDYTGGSHTFSTTTAPDGTQTAVEVITGGPSNSNASAVWFSGAGGNPGGYSSIYGHTFTHSVWARIVSGSCGGAHIGFENNVDWEGGTGFMQLSSSWQRFAYTHTFTDVNDSGELDSFIQVFGQCDVALWGDQLEESRTVGPYIATSGSSATGTGYYALLNAGPLSAGSHTVAAGYGGDGNNSSSTSVNVGLAVAKSGTLTTVSSSTNPSTAGQGVTFTSGINTGGASPSGSVVFKDAGTTLGSGTSGNVSTTNIAPYSNFFWPWSINAASLGAEIADPFGYSIAQSLTMQTAANTSEIYQSLNGVSYAGQTFTLSGWFQVTAGGPEPYLRIEQCGAPYDGFNSSAAPVGVGWVRISVTGTFSGADSGNCLNFIVRNNTTNAGSVGIYGLQVEKSGSLGPYVDTYSSAVTGVGGSTTYSTTSLSAATHSITANYSGDTNTTSSTSSALSQVVNKGTPTISASCSPNPVTYGGTYTCTANVGSGATGTVSWPVVLGGETTTLSGGTTSTSVRTATANAGPYSGTVTYNGDSNNYSTSTTASLTVAKAVITVTANNQSMTYAGAVPSLTASYSGFQNGDTTAVISGSPSLSTSATPTSPVGTYTINCGVGSLSATNYTFACVNGTLTIGAAALSITPNAQNKTYGSTLTIPGTAFTSSGLKNSDTVSSVMLTSPGTAATAGAGGYTISGSNATGTGLGNYSITYNTGTLTVSKATLTVAANNASMSYGGAVPGFSPSYTGFQNSDTTAVLSGAPSLSTSANSGSPVGSYAITCGVGTLSAANYTFTCVNGTLTIGAAALSITPNAQNKSYGSALTIPGTAFTPFGLKNSDTVSSVTMTSPGTAATAAVGSYTISSSAASGTGLTNYSITYNTATLTVSKATLTVTANNAAMNYAGAVPGLSPNYSGFQNGETATILSGAPSLTTTATSSSPVGSYTITCGIGTLGAANYTFVCVNGVLTIAKATPLVGISSSLNPAMYGSPVTFTATVPASTTGSITFMDGIAPLGTAPISGTVAMLATTALEGGADSITAVYSGDSNNNAATSPVLVQTMNKAPLAVTGNSSLSPATYGDSVSFTFTFTGAGAVPTGTATISIDGTAVATVTLDAAGNATYTPPSLAAGSHTVVATYNGNGDYF